MIVLYPEIVGYTTRIRMQMNKELRRNADIFSFSLKDMTWIPVTQKLRNFGQKRDGIVKQEVRKLLKAGHIRPTNFPKCLANVVWS